MADRRTDDTPLAPRRPLSGPSKEESEPASRSLTERVSSALSTAGSAVASAASAGPSSTRERTSVTRGSGPQERDTTTTGTAQRPTSAAPGRPRGTRRARLRLVHLDPWSVMKTSFLLSIAFGIVLVVAVAVVWSVLGAAGVWDSINKTVTNVIGGDSAQTFDVRNYVGTSRVLGFTMIVAVVDVVLITAISTLGAFLYNLAAALLGGVEVTLAEDEH
ncbi:MAG: DUF3566 domain-containing protein [Nocardioidaceae bacterium]